MAQYSAHRAASSVTSAALRFRRMPSGMLSQVAIQRTRSKSKLSGVDFSLSRQEAERPAALGTWPTTKAGQARASVVQGDRWKETALK